MPAGIATTQVKTNENNASTIVSTSRSPISSALGRWYSSERPRLPRARFSIHRRYWTQTGRSRPYSRRSASICSALIELPDDASVATWVVRKSPGGAWTIAKTVTENRKRRRGSRRRRLRTYRVIGALSSHGSRTRLDRSERSYYFMGHAVNGERPGEAAAGGKGRADARGDPHARPWARDPDRLRGADDRPPGRGPAHVQERPVCPLCLEGGPAARAPPDGGRPNGRDPRQARPERPARRGARPRPGRSLARVGAVAEPARGLPVHGGLVRARRPARPGARLRRPEPARLDGHAGRRRSHRGAGGPLPRRPRLRAVRPRLPGDRSGVRARLAPHARPQSPYSCRHRVRRLAPCLPRALAHGFGHVTRRLVERTAPLRPGEEISHD